MRLLTVAGKEKLKFPLSQSLLGSFLMQTNSKVRYIVYKIKKIINRVHIKFQLSEPLMEGKVNHNSKTILYSLNLDNNYFHPDFIFRFRILDEFFVFALFFMPILCILILR